MLSETLDETLRGYEIGEKVHALRMKKKMGLVELAKHTGFSPALLSKIERSRMYPPLATLLRIALVFGVGLEYFFTNETKSRVSIVRREERQRFPADPDSRQVSYWFESLDFRATERKMSSFLAEFEARESQDSPEHAHDGAEHVFVLEGKFGIRIGREEHELAAGDAVYFDPSVPHAYRRIGKRKCMAVVTTVP
jgi:transcriptional regulator with XRE-family HTH domain